MLVLVLVVFTCNTRDKTDDILAHVHIIQRTGVLLYTSMYDVRLILAIQQLQLFG